VSTIAALVRTTSTTEHDWRLSELVLKTTAAQDLPEIIYEAFIENLNSGDFQVEDLDAPAAFVAAFTYCG
jgi:hypothetical protein